MQVEVGVTEYKAVWPTKARDFVMLTVWDEPRSVEGVTAAAAAPANEKYVVASQSVPHARCPPQKAFVRGCVECGGYVIRAVPQRPDVCHLTMVTQSDPGGDLPIAIVNKLSQTAPIKVLKALRKCMEGK